MRKILLFSSLFLMPQLHAATVTGTYSSDRSKESVSISVQGKSKVVHPDKKGRFSLKGVDLDTDVVRISPNAKDTFQISLQGHSVLQIEEQEDMLTVQLVPPPVIPSPAYDGIIIMQNELLMTGETNSLSAVNVKYPQSPATTFNGTLAPLYFLDGVEVSDISYITVQETSYVEVVRPSNPSCSAFGSRGGNGMILLTTQTRFSVQYPEKDRLKPRRLMFPLE